mmetsp:Transcript_30595/g.42720  ORF Transcript_30595/g.42720 Transcript_30595/m.42720 type:complete len:95 (-) Transcript_30595:6-290(-)
MSRIMAARLAFAFAVLLSPIALFTCLLAKIPMVSGTSHDANANTLSANAKVLDLTCEKWETAETGILVALSVFGPATFLTLCSLFTRRAKTKTD